MKDLLRPLLGGDRRSVRGVAEVVSRVSANPKLFPIVFDGLSNADPLVQMRCADAVEKITVGHPEYLKPYKQRIIELACTAEQQEVRWHLAQMLSRVDLNARERRRVVRIMERYLTDRSSIVRTFAMQTLADMAVRDAGLRDPILKLLETLTRTGSPAMKSRGHKLLARMSRSDDVQDEGNPTDCCREAHPTK
jgi:hypothetical protein